MTNLFSKNATAFMVIIVLIAWMAPGLQLYILIRDAEKNGLTSWQATGRFFGYFTILSNLLVAISFSFILMKPLSSIGRFFSKSSTLTAIAIYIFMVGLLYNIMLRHIWEPTGMHKWVDEFLHVVVPLLVVIFWLLFVPRVSLNWRSVFGWLIYPAIYFVYAMIRGTLSGFYPYPFINVKELGYTRVFLNAGGILLAFMIAGFLFIGIDKLMSRSDRPAIPDRI